MRRILPVALGCILLAFPLFAQRGGHGGGGGMHGGGSARGGFSGGAFRGGSGFRSGTPFRGGGFRGGGFRGIGGFRGRVGFRGFFGFPNYYPGFYRGFYDPYLWDYGDSGDYGYGYPDNGYGYAAGGAYPSYSSPSPQVLVISNQTAPVEPIVQPLPAPSVWNAVPNTQAKKYEDPLYLLAMKDGTIRAVLAYWVDGATVHYVTMDHEQKQTTLSSLDRGLSVRLNRERNVTFQLPG